MFTGLIECVGQVEALQTAVGGARLRVRCAEIAGELALGESVAVNGACLTVRATDGGSAEFDVSAESLRRTTLAGLRPGRGVNLERALVAGARLGGHLVNGHVDGTGRVIAVEPGGEFARWRFGLAAGLLRYVVEKGSIAVDGTSLTVASVYTDGFDTALIPTTIEQTTFRQLAPGDAVNIEIDIVAKYVERLTAPYAQPGPSPLLDALKRNGYINED